MRAFVVRSRHVWEAVRAESMRDEIVAEEAKLAEQERRVVQTRERIRGMREELAARQPPVVTISA